VIGATGSGPFVAGLLGSTADRVVRKSTCPVLVVRGELRVPPRRVLAPVDLSTLSGDALRCGLHLLAQVAPGEKVEVQAVYALRFPDSFELQRRRRESSAAEIARQSEEELQRFILENRSDSPFEVETAVLPEQAPFAILDELNEHPADLVMLGTHGRSGLDRLMMGSVASTIVRKAPCSVLLISPEAALAEAAPSQSAWYRERVSAA
jgi:nucleotide-binding universal stress UspA family protein